MRADLFLKKTRLIKRRTQAKLALDKGLILKDNIPIKPSYNLKQGDIITLNFFSKIIVFKVISIDEKTPKYELIG